MYKGCDTLRVDALWVYKFFGETVHLEGGWCAKGTYRDDAYIGQLEDKPCRGGLASQVVLCLVLVKHGVRVVLSRTGRVQVDNALSAEDHIVCP